MISNSNFFELKANEKRLLPLKKPILSEKELKKKVLVNILKPLAKPKKEIEKAKLKVNKIEKEKKY